jgi:hypothetical protein
MTEQSSPAPSSRRSLRLFVLAATGIFWLYTFRLIDVNSNPMGDGLEGMAIFPFGFIFFGLEMGRVHGYAKFNTTPARGEGEGASVEGGG